MPSQKYFAYHVDPQGQARSSYELRASDDDSAKTEARYFLKFHSTIDVWQGARRIVHITR